MDMTDIWPYDKVTLCCKAEHNTMSVTTQNWEPKDDKPHHPGLSLDPVELLVNNPMISGKPVGETCLLAGQLNFEFLIQVSLDGRLSCLTEVD